MSTTIDSLDIQISTSSGQSAEKIQAIANALGELKNQGKIGAATSAMKSLAKALDVLNPSLNALNPAKLQQLRATMSSLSGIQKASGLNSTVNTLKKIPEMLNALDDTTLVKLELSMKRLSRAIAPLALEIDKLGTGFAKLPKTVSQIITGTNRMAKATERATKAAAKQGDGLNKQSINIMSAISNFESLVHVLQLVSNGLANTLAGSMEWEGIQFRFGRAFGEDAEEVYAYAQKINDVLGINIQQFMQYSSLYGSLLSGFGMAQEKVTTISVGLTELSYDIWAAYNDRFKSLEDASEAVRSAITGEIEPIRNAGIALTEASLQEYLDGVGMAKVSIEKLSEAQKAEVRYAAMMDAAMNQGIVGTYAKEMKTAEGAVRDLSQSFKTLTQAFGSLFIPIIQTAIPYVTAFINLLYEAVQAVANFFGVTLFKIDWGDGASGIGGEMEKAAAGAAGVGSGLGSAAKAAKKIRDYTMGFDELNVIQPPDESAGGGGGSAGNSGVNWGDGLDLKTMWNDSVFAEAARQVDELKQKIQDWFAEWKTEIAVIAGALGALSMATMLGHLGEALNLGDKFLGVLGTIKKVASTAIVITLQYTLMSEFFAKAIEEGSWKDYILAIVTGAIGTGILYSMWGPAGIIIGLGVTAVASFKAVIENGGITNGESAAVAFTGVASAIGGFLLMWNKVKDTDFGMFFRLIKEGNPVLDTFAAAFPKISGAISSVTGWISSAASAIGGFLGGISAPVWGAIVGVVAAIASAALFLYRNWDKVTKAAKDFFDENIAPKLEEIKGHWDNIVEAIQPVIGAIEWLLEPIVTMAENFGLWWEAAKPLSVLGDIFEVVGGIIFSVVSGVIAGAFNMLIGMIENVVQVFSGIVQIVGGVIDFVVALFTGGDIEAACGKICDGVADVFAGLVGLVLDPVKDLVDGVINWFVELWDELVGHSIVPDMVKAIIEWFEKLPHEIVKSVQNFANNVIKKFQDMWSKVKSWWNSTVAPKFTQSYWKNVFSNVVTGATAKLGEIKGKISDVWDGVKSWFNTNVAPKLTLAYWKNKFSNIVQGIKDKWTEARTWWNSNKPSLNTVQAVVASVKDKLSSAWDTARSWWNNSKSALNTISVTVGSIKSKLESAWTTARDWLEEQALKLNIKIPHFSIGYNSKISSWELKLWKEMFNVNGRPFLDVKWYAQGGFPGNSGQLFVAQEAGPELVGKIGNRNAVINNDQIVAAVSQGVYSAVVEAMRGSGSGQSVPAINVYLDGKQITATVEKHQKERGAALMTGGMAYGY